MNITEEQEEIKKEFQLERVILFSDAVFAIIITIMVIDVKLPEAAKTVDAEHLKDSFKELLPKIFAYCLSFFLVSGFWLRHLKLFSFLRDHNVPLLCLNLLFLFSVSLFPFAASLVSGIVHLSALANGWGVNIYVSIFLLTFFTQTLLTFYLFRNRETLCINNVKMDRVLMWDVTKWNMLIIPLVVLGVYVINYLGLNPMFTLYSLAVLGISRSILERIYYPENNTGPFLIRSFRYITSKRRHKKIVDNKDEPDPTA